MNKIMCKMGWGPQGDIFLLRSPEFFRYALDTVIITGFFLLVLEANEMRKIWASRLC